MHMFSLQERGFTLVELLVTIAIAAIMVSLAAPSFMGKLTKERVKSHAYDVAQSLKERRANAAVKQKESKEYTVEGSDNVVLSVKTAGAPTKIVFNNRGLAGSVKTTGTVTEFESLTTEVEYEFTKGDTTYSLFLSPVGKVRVVED